jgi:uncharacterized membrane protein YadS
MSRAIMMKKTRVILLYGIAILSSCYQRNRERERERERERKREREKG